MGWRVVNDAMQIMGGEGYMTENEVERIFRDSRINLIVEGANEVMQSFIFAYGGKQLAEKMLGVQQAVGWDHADSVGSNLARIFKGLKSKKVMKAAAPLGAELLLGLRPPAPVIHDIHPSLQDAADRLGDLVSQHSHEFKRASKHYGERIVTRQSVQARLADSAMWLHAWACSLSKLNRDVRRRENPTQADARFERDKAAAIYFMDMAASAIREALSHLFENDDQSMLAAAKAALQYAEQLPNNRFAIPESSPNAKGTGRVVDQSALKQFPGESR
jgi:alkylation response protein AidB-like acyl-CoA dehydrogenase